MDTPNQIFKRIRNRSKVYVLERKLDNFILFDDIKFLEKLLDFLDDPLNKPNIFFHYHKTL